MKNMETSLPDEHGSIEPDHAIVEQTNANAIGQGLTSPEPNTETTNAEDSSSETSSTSHNTRELTAVMDPSHGPVMLNIHLEPFPANWQNKAGIPHAFQLSKNERCRLWYNAFRTSDLYMIGTNRIPETLYELVPFAWYNERSIDNLLLLLCNLAEDSERWERLTSPAGDSASGCGIAEDNEDHMVSGDEDSVVDDDNDAADEEPRDTDKEEEEEEAEQDGDSMVDCNNDDTLGDEDKDEECTTQ
ncbi:hypothetical protein COCCADRAFT_4241 [Bipolaris zeicola 26-R-13]|uniref:Uncharacterized protein n=1 Tax=Cochliobolus carbonum (strain 26-R-13) TaxID=930089 RepID=W6YSB7_COCC2|nr:uncharacterized protein COCCADRAFT_4241 [Bipolaris zeicola 26-R-13]EUC34406.1 hypothetical protein COCCADRAFT_4241 [Bipolaris zeicola 26-R-13]